MRFRKKPVEIDAVQWNGNNVSEITSFLPAGGIRFTFSGIEIDTLEGRMLASEGDWIIRGIKGEFYPCKPEIFEATYELQVGEQSSVCRDGTSGSGHPDAGHDTSSQSVAVQDLAAHKVMTPEEYAAMPLIGWHRVCRDVDGFGGVGVQFEGPALTPAQGREGE